MKPYCEYNSWREATFGVFLGQGDIAVSQKSKIKSIVEVSDYFFHEIHGMFDSMPSCWRRCCAALIKSFYKNLKWILPNLHGRPRTIKSVCFLVMSRPKTSSNINPSILHQERTSPCFSILLNENMVLPMNQQKKECFLMDMDMVTLS